jgi:ribosomal protein RSM22 (predicted rRNA methylase)
LKEGELSYEDEKFSYVVLVKEPAVLEGARVVRHPVTRPGLVELALCEEAGLRRMRVTKKDGERWRLARKAEWGDEWAG